MKRVFFPRLGIVNEATGKVRVLRIIARMNIGGPAIQVTNLMQSLPASEFEQLLISGYCRENEKEYLKEDEVKFRFQRIRHLGRAINPVSDLFAIYEIRRVIKEFKPDIIHTHTFKAGLVGRLAAKTLLRRILLVHTFHGHLLHGYFGRIGTRIVVVIERLLANNTACLISVGTKVKDDLLASNIGIAEQYKVINPGFKIGMPKFLARSNLGFHEDDFICGWFGRLTKIKRADRVLEISKFARFSTSRRVKFVIVGDGENRKELETQSQQLQLPIVFQGWQSDVPSIMKVCDLVVCTSENEGTPISLIEAQMLGIPVVSTNVGSVQEVLMTGETGFVLDYDPKEFWQKIEFLMKERETYKRFSRKSSEFALNSFSLDRFITQHAQLYKNILVVKPFSRQ